MTLPAMFALSSCSQVAVVLWTDMAEIAPAVEAFNAAQDQRVVEIEVVSDVSTQLRLAPRRPDLVISSYLEDSLTAEFFQPLDGLLRREMGREIFYADLLESGRRNGRQLLLPISFNLPLLYYVEPVRPVGEARIIDQETVEARSESFNNGTGEGWTNLAFSPVWNHEFLYQYLRAQGFAVSEAEDGVPAWDPSVVDTVLDRVDDWVTEANGSRALDTEFRERYLYAPQLQLVRSGRIGYGYATSDQFFSLEDAQRSGLGFRWYGESGKISVLENVVFAAVPQEARNVAGAQEFLTFLLSEERQAQILEESLKKQIDAFGIVGGMSSLWRGTEQKVPDYYRELQGMIPARLDLRFPEPSPRHWGSLVDEVIEPWLVREATDTPQSRDLETAVRAWLLQQEQ
jgi:hypothetical protein